MYRLYIRHQNRDIRGSVATFSQNWRVKYFEIGFGETNIKLLDSLGLHHCYINQLWLLVPLTLNGGVVVAKKSDVYELLLSKIGPWTSHVKWHVLGIVTILWLDDVLEN